jgi:hypothetical protein
MELLLRLADEIFMDLPPERRVEIQNIEKRVLDQAWRELGRDI